MRSLRGKRNNCKADSMKPGAMQVSGRKSNFKVMDIYYDWTLDII